jgi:hypothetical protein
VNWRAVTWLAVAVMVAAAVGLALDAGLAGVTQASGLAGVIVGFCELGALLLAVVSWTAERRRASAEPDPAPAAAVTPEPAAATPEPAPPQTAPPQTATPEAAPAKYVVDLRDAHGVQVGDHNIQHNVYGRDVFRRGPGQPDGR